MVSSDRTKYHPWFVSWLRSVHRRALFKPLATFDQIKFSLVRSKHLKQTFSTSSCTNTHGQHLFYLDASPCRVLNFWIVQTNRAKIHYSLNYETIQKHSKGRIHALVITDCSLNFRPLFRHWVSAVLELELGLNIGISAKCSAIWREMEWNTFSTQIRFQLLTERAFHWSLTALSRLFLTDTYRIKIFG